MQALSPSFVLRLEGQCAFAVLDDTAADHSAAETKMETMDSVAWLLGVGERGCRLALLLQPTTKQVSKTKQTSVDPGDN